MPDVPHPLCLNGTFPAPVLRDCCIPDSTLARFPKGKEIALSMDSLQPLLGVGRGCHVHNQDLPVRTKCILRVWGFEACSSEMRTLKCT